MKLKTYNTENIIRQGKYSKPYICISRTGKFAFNSVAVILLGIKEGTPIDFHQDPKNEKNWYVEANTENGFKVRYDKKSRVYLINSTKLASIILNQLNSENKSERLVVGEQVEINGKILHTLITAHIYTKAK